jgi:hypothetical protein
VKTLSSTLLTLTLNLDDPAAQSGDIAGRKIEENAGSEASLDIIRKWVDVCSKSHVECLPSTSLNYPAQTVWGNIEDTILPTRLIDIGPSDGTGRPFLKVTNGERGRYISLSHCWGKSTQFTTIKETLNARMQGFSMELLPKTFQDAIIISRSLGIRYLWIDSICIVQDSSVDWEQESARMAAIYSNAFLTIAATASPDSRTGCLFRRAQQQVATFTYHPPSDPAAIGNVFVNTNQQFLRDPLHKYPLNRRAWTLQERLLSRRIIHFAAEQLFWDCQHHFLSENGMYAKRQIGSANDPLRQSIHQLDFYAPDLPYHHPAFSWRASILGRWMDLVNEFSKRELTYDSDALPALAGVVSRFAARTGDQFLAGIWRSTFHIELLWLAPDSPKRAPKEYRAPSWSWAALVGESLYFNYSDSWKAMVPDLEIVSVDVRWAGDPFTSSVIPATLSVTGMLEPAHYVNEPSWDILDEILAYKLVPAPLQGWDARSYAFVWAIFDQAPPPEEQMLWCLCVCRRYTREYWVLILEEVSIKTYRRIGLGRIDVKTGVFGGKHRKAVDLV